MNHYMRVGEALLHYGLVTKKQLDRALLLHAQSQMKLGEVLISLGYVSEREVIACIAEQFGYDVIDPAQADPSPDSLAALPADFALANCVLPLRITESKFSCAICDPIDVNLTDCLQVLVKRQIDIVLAKKEPLSKAIWQAYAAIGVDVSNFKESATATMALPPSKRRKKSEERWDREALLALAAQLPNDEPKKGIFGWKAA